MAANCDPSKAVRTKVNRVAQGKHPTSGLKFDLVSAWAGLAGLQASPGDDHMAGVVEEMGAGELDGSLEHIDLDRLASLAAWRNNVTLPRPV